MHIKNSKGWAAVQSAANAGFFDIVLRLVQVGLAVCGWARLGASAPGARIWGLCTLGLGSRALACGALGSGLACLGT